MAGQSIPSDMKIRVLIADRLIGVFPAHPPHGDGGFIVPGARVRVSFVWDGQLFQADALLQDITPKRNGN